MDEEKLDDMLESYLSSRIELPERGTGCPPVEKLAGYVSGSLESEELYSVGNHVKSCKFCSELIEGALLYSSYEKHIKVESVPEKVKNKAKALNPAFKTTESKIWIYLKRNVWFMFSLASFMASFFIPRHFLQFLILALILGLKWIFSRESMRVLIMIYNAWKRHDRIGEKDLEGIFKNRF